MPRYYVLNPTRIVGTYVPIAHQDFSAYPNQLKLDALDPIGKLETGDMLRWYCFLIHPSDMLSGREPPGDTAFIHLLLQPKDGMEIEHFFTKLPSHFRKPIENTLGQIGGLDCALLRDGDWRYAWKMIGESSEWVLSLLEAHANEQISLQQIIQFLHYITNPLQLGNCCLCAPHGFIQF